MARSKAPAGGKPEATPTPETPPAGAPVDALAVAEEQWPGAWPEELPEGLWPRLLLAQAHGGSISKTGRNTHHGYDFTRVEDVIRVGSKILSRAGLVAHVDPWEIKLTEGATSNSKRSVECEAKSTLWIVNPAQPEEKVGFPIIGTGTDSPGDKAIYKAQSGGKKYAWQDALTLAFGDDPEENASSPDAVDQQARGATAPAYGLALKNSDKRVILDAAALLLTAEGGANQEAAKEVLESIVKDCGYFPKVVADVVYRLAQKLRELDPTLADADPPPPEDDAAAKAEAEQAQAAAEQGDVPADPDSDPNAPDDETDHERAMEEEQTGGSPAGGDRLESDLPAPDTEGLFGDPAAGDDDYEPKF